MNGSASRNFEIQSLVRQPQRRSTSAAVFGAREDESQIAVAFRQRDQFLTLLRGDDHIFYPRSGTSAVDA